MRKNNSKNNPCKLPENFLAILNYGDSDAIKDVFKTCSLDATFGHDEQSAIFYSYRMQKEIVHWLGEQGADINARNKWGETPLHEIITHTQYELHTQLYTVDLLISLGADIHAVTPRGATPLHYAAEWGELAIVERLINNHADIYAKTKKGENPLEYMMVNSNNSRIRNILPVAEYFLSIGVPVTDIVIRSVEKLAKSFTFHREVFNRKHLEETEEALGRLLKLFGVPAPPPKRIYDGKAKIIPSPGSWQEQFEELYLWILTPSLVVSKEGTVQGELLRLSGGICRLILDGFTTSYGEFNTRVKFYSYLRYLHMGNSLSREEIREAKLVIKEIIHEEKIVRPEKLCELSLRWIQKNPDPIPLGITFYKG